MFHKGELSPFDRFVDGSTLIDVSSDLQSNLGCLLTCCEAVVSSIHSVARFHHKSTSEQVYRHAVKLVESLILAGVPSDAVDIHNS